MELQQVDTFCNEIKEYLENPKLIPFSKRGFIKRFSINNETNLLVYQAKTKQVIVLPIDHCQTEYSPLKICLYFHNRIEAGHLGIQKTYQKILEFYFWKNMINDITTFIRSCHQCQINKPGIHQQDGLLKPLPIPDNRFETIQIDFASMPLDKSGTDTMMLIVDKFSKYTKVIPLKQNHTTREVAQAIYIHWYLDIGGLPDNLVSDRDSRFTGEVFGEFAKLVGIKQIMSTARHQQTDGLAEIRIRHIKDMLKTQINYNQDNWVELLPHILFALNRTENSTTKYSPYYLAFAYQPKLLPSKFSLESTTTLGKQFQIYHFNQLTAHNHLIHSQEKSTQEYDKKRTKSPIYQVGQFALLKREGIQWAADNLRPKAKLLSQYIGPFKILTVNTELDNVTLDIPQYMTTIHPILHFTQTLHLPKIV